ncbi:MAG: TlpA disulfide reductase family protein [Nitrospiraceae bacterium]|nr:TlpA disulfide reductase family protein [Nitrospiraceae bacterium]
MKKVLLVLFLLALIGPVACSRNGAGTRERHSAQLGGVAPDFVLKGVDGKEVALSHFRGKMVLLEFWATWCPPCRATVPELTAIQEKYSGKGLVVLAISLDEGADLPAKLSFFSKEFKINYRLLIGNEETERAYNVRSIPMTFLIDRQGKVVASYVGYVDNLAAVVSEQMDKTI